MVLPHTALSHIEIEWLKIVEALLLMMVGWLCARLAVKTLDRLISNRLSKQGWFITRRVTSGFIIGLFLLGAAQSLGFNFSILLGTAGLFTLAFGFAAQTSVSNMIGGIFLVVERAFVVGDTIRINDITGKLLSIDLLSVKLRTDKDVYVRIPNEILIKSNVMNLTKYPKRVFECEVKVAYEANLDDVYAVLLAVAQSEPHASSEPAPELKVKSFDGLGITIQASYWIAHKYYAPVSNVLMKKIQEALLAKHIPLPKLYVHH